MRHWGLSIVLLFGGMISCGYTSTKTTVVPAVRCTDRCTSDPTNSYEILVPERKSSDQTFPLLVILDPHGSGKTALNHFLLTAERYPMVLVASNRVQNNLADYEAVIRTLLADVQKKYPVGETVYLSGFSGGARMAIDYALKNPVNGLVLSGALAGAQEISQLACTVYSISGTDDFNFMETAQYLFREADIPSNLKIELTRSSHSWPDSTVLADAFGFVRLAGKDVHAEEADLKEFNKRMSTKIDSLRAGGQLLSARCLARNMVVSPPFNSDKTFVDLENRLKTDPGYVDQMRRLLANLQMEAGVRETYIQAFDTKDTSWWKNELEKMDEQIRTATDPLEQDACRRIKGFWGIACYSLCNRAAGNNDAQALRRYVAVYRVLEPQNPDMLRFSKLLGQPL